MKMGEKITKDQINGSDLYFLKKIHVILLIVGFLVINSISVASLYFSLRADVKTNTVQGIKNSLTVAVHEVRLDTKHDQIIILDLTSKRIEANLEAYMEANGFVYIK